jgi:uncharacterized protein YecE (DUF72 family)
MPQLRVGCSGWNYKSWKGPFYPVDLPPSEWLDYYGGRFDTVEINNTFYRLPQESTFASWRAGTPYWVLDGGQSQPLPDAHETPA